MRLATTSAGRTSASAPSRRRLCSSDRPMAVWKASAPNVAAPATAIPAARSPSRHGRRMASVIAIRAASSGSDECGSSSHGAAAAELQLLDRGGHDHALMMPAEVWHVADLFERVLSEDEDPRLHSLES